LGQITNKRRDDDTVYYDLVSLSVHHIALFMMIFITFFKLFAMARSGTSRPVAKVRGVGGDPA